MATHSNSNNTTINNNHQSFHLFALPPELRNRIYSFVFPRRAFDINTGSFPTHPLLLVSRQFRAEIIGYHDDSIVHVETAQCCPAGGHIVGCLSNQNLQGDWLIRGLGRALVARLPQIGEVFLSPRRVRQLFRGKAEEEVEDDVYVYVEEEEEEDEEEEEGRVTMTMTEVEVWDDLGPLAQLAQQSMHGQLVLAPPGDEISLREVAWGAMIAVLQAQGFVCSAVRQRLSGCDGDGPWEQDEWFVKFE